MKYFFNFFLNVMFYDFIYLAKGFRMRPKVRSTLNNKWTFQISKSGLDIYGLNYFKSYFLSILSFSLKPEICS